MQDFRGHDIHVGDRVVPIGWGEGIPLTLSNTKATVIGFGRKRVMLRFDSYSYDEVKPHHSGFPKCLRLLDDE